MPLELDETMECHHVAGLSCEWKLTMEGMEVLLGDEEVDFISIRPIHDSLTCTNCLLGQIVQYFRAVGERAPEDDSEEKKE